MQPVLEDLDQLITKCDLDGKNFKIISKPVEGWQSSVDQVLNSIDSKILTFGSELNHTQLSKCEDLMSWFQKTIILNDTYVKIWVNPFENNVPEVLMNEIKTKMIPLPQLKPGGAKFKSFETMYVSPDSHTAKDRPLSHQQKKKSVAPGYSLSGKQRDVIKCFE